MTPLSLRTLDSLPSHVRRFSYHRGSVRCGIAHLSVGNFHRAHQAWYLDRLLGLPGNSEWGICGIGLLDIPAERDKAAGMKAQDGLYTLTRYDAHGEAARQVVGSIADYLLAPDDPELALQRLSDPVTRVVTMTITEGGYNQDRQTGRYDLDAPSVRAELQSPHRPVSAFGYIVEALRRRRDAGIAPFTVQSCDNLNGNGHVARDAVVSHARALDPALAEWIDASVAFPNSMVDGVTPAVGSPERQRLNEASGIDDLLPVFCEDYADWVIEDQFCNDRPSWEQFGVRMVDDVQPFEHAKLHMLNASHSLLAYPSTLAGYRRVDEAMADPLIRQLLDQYMERDAIPMLRTPPGVDLRTYKTLLLDRFANPAIGDQVARLAGGGTVKLPVFLGPVVRAVTERSEDMQRLALGIACFLRYLAGVNDRDEPIEVAEPALRADDLALARNSDPSAVLRMGLLRDIGVQQGSPLAARILSLRQDIAQRGALAVTRDILQS